MSYTLQAIIANPDQVAIAGSCSVELPQDYILIPFSDAFREIYQIPFLPLTDEDLVGLPDELNSLCARLSETGELAYVEAEYFGGTGEQSSAVWKGGECVGLFAFEPSAINLALQLIGVNRDGMVDEFDALGLGRYRDTERWLPTS